MQKIEDIIENVRELRDADYHVCNYSVWQSKGEPQDTKDNTDCSCEDFDLVIDKLELYLIEQKTNKTTND
jgi:hypothetical protein